MSDELVKRLREIGKFSFGWTADQAANAIEQLIAERDEALNQLDSARYSVEVLEKRVAKFMADNARLREALNGLLTSVEHADFEDGRCCCGDDMLHHQSPMDCGHTPVDMGEYHASLAIKKARAALKGESHE